MTAYVDELVAWAHARHRCFKNGSAHLTSDDVAEPHAFAARLGLKRAWFQSRSIVPHYGLSPAKRELAVRHGAVVMEAREQARRRREQRNG